MTISAEQTILRIEMLARRDPGGRGLAAAATTRDLLAAARELAAGNRVILVTGFYIIASGGENDGVSGTLAVADALRRLGKEVVLVTDEHSLPLLHAGMAVFGTAFRIVALSRNQKDADRAIDALLTSFRPTHVVAIERPGSAVDGHRYSMRGERLDAFVPAADRLLVPPTPRDFTTIAIGDGGNELGLGSLREALMDKVTHGELIFCATPADYVIPAGISNWGAFALTAALALSSGQLLLRPPAHERAVLEALSAAGAIDGCTKEHTFSVDGLAWPDYAETLSAIYEETRRALTLQRRSGT
ncbi:glutamate cyclase domain-containing protein [Propionivibrio limicola]|uniref:glutamate cyclase domain-containing protein n=1 Tax=Propionivibrio limicola TaxID=167645 RepID=UPI0012909733|nr:glutamate cyclase domain-containing protein [Propionivibrio limicola]